MSKTPPPPPAPMHATVPIRRMGSTLPHDMAASLSHGGEVYYVTTSDVARAITNAVHRRSDAAKARPVGRTE